ncbi:MAG: alpha/beta hydrolase [Eubacteriales bacterium]|nr:alpha/beta hydrolase [Eubacteriales bacterium]
MKQVLNVEVEKEVLSLITGVTYSNVPFWFGAARQDMKMDLVIPKHIEGHKPCPVVVWVCGGSFLVNDKSVWMPEMMKFARKGYVVASVSYRTSNDAPFPAALIDVKAAIRYLKAHAKDLCIDPNRIFIMGESAGGALASLAGTTGDQKEYDQGDYLEYDSCVNGVVDFYGLVDMRGITTMHFVGEGVPSYTLEAFLGCKGNREIEEKASAVCQISENTPPFLILHGAEDPVVPLSQGETFYNALTEKGIQADYLIIEGATHGDDKFYQDEMVDRIVAFFESVPEK